MRQQRAMRQSKVHTAHLQVMDIKRSNLIATHSDVLVVAASAAAAAGCERPNPLPSSISAQILQALQPT